MTYGNALRVFPAFAMFKATTVVAKLEVVIGAAEDER